MLVGLFVFVRTTRALRLMNGWAVFVALLTKEARFIARGAENDVSGLRRNVSNKKCTEEVING